MNRFAGKNVWVVGASSGIGAALAVAFARDGANVILSARRVDKLEKVREQCGSGLIFPIDLSCSDTLETIAKNVESQSNGIDILVLNAGISQRTTALETPLDATRLLMEVNFFAPVLLTKAILPYMIQRKCGQIVVVTSVMGKFGAQMRSSYAATKHALHGYFDSVREEHYADGITVTLLVPGYIKTEISMNAIGAGGVPYGKMDHGQERGMPADVCAAKMLKAIFLKRDEALIGGIEVWGTLLKRWCPALLKKILRKKKTIN